jgi:phosphoribosyl 1,2-cyclic phosphodiesterase
MSSAMSVTFWGVRGSYPMPGPTTARVGGNTSCIEVRAGNHLIIFDAGTGIIGLGRALIAQQRRDGKPITATMFFTHTHHDHTQGFPFFNPIYLPTTTLYIFGPKTLSEDLEQVLSRAMLPPVFPVDFAHLPCVRAVRNLSEGEAIILNNGNADPHIFAGNRTPPPPGDDRIVIRAMRSPAHPQGVFVYCIEYGGKSLVYATDTEGYAGGDQRLIRFVQGATVLIHDSQYTEGEYASPTSPRQGWGHSTWQMAVNVAQASQVQRLVLYHHEPEHDDDTLDKIEQEAQQQFPATVLAREGMCIEI